MGHGFFIASSSQNPLLGGYYDPGMTVTMVPSQGDAIPARTVGSGKQGARRNVFKYAVAGVLVIGILSIGAQAATQALFTNTASVGANTFTAGTVDIATTPSTALVTLTAMAPGDDVYGSIDISNGGTLDLRYAVKSTTTENVMAADLDLTVRGPAASGTGCDAAGFGTFGTGVEYGAADLGSTTGINLIGDPTQGSQAGDRTLTAGSNEFMCFKVSLPLAIGNASQGLTTTATVDFMSEQTKNN